jgi:hypothetical protein
MKKILFISILFTLFFCSQSYAKKENKSKDCNAYACSKPHKIEGKPSVFLKNKGEEPIVCFIYVDQRKKLFLLGPSEKSKTFSTRYQESYHYFSWNCGKTSACPIWGKRLCK